MKRLALVSVATALTLAACGGASAPVATVGGADITRGEVEGLVREADTILDSEFLTYLGVAIQWAAVEQAAQKEFGLDPTDDEVDKRIDELVAAAGAEDYDAYLESINASDQGYRRYARQLILQEGIAEQLETSLEPATDEDVKAELDEFPMEWTEACVFHILVETSDEADDVLNRLDAGEDFADIAKEVSTDPGSGADGGDLGCSSPTQYVPEFADAVMTAEIGVPTAPVESEFGFHIIRVDSRTVADDEVVREYLEGQARADLMEEWFLGVIEAADVTIDSEIGTWTTDPTPTVLPPS